MPIGATIGAIGSIGSAAIGASAASKAASKQAQAAQSALDYQKSVSAPYLDTGKSALYSLAGLYGLPTPDNPNGGASGVNSAWQAFQNLPAYQFPLQQGSLALERQLNAQGRQLSGAQVRGQQQFGQGLASQYLMSNYVSPLMQIAGMGANTATQSGQQVGASYGNLGQAQASGIIGMGNSIAGGVNSAASNLALYSALGRNGGAGSGNLSPTYGSTYGGYDGNGVSQGFGSFGGIQYPSY